MLDHSLFCSLPSSYLDVTHKTKREHRAILRKARRLIKSSDAPPSLKGLAKGVDVSVGYLEYRHPVLVQDVVSRYAEYEDHERIKRICRAQRVALEFFVSEKYAKEPHSRKQAYRTLRAETGLPKYLLRRAIQRAYSAIY